MSPDISMFVLVSYTLLNTRSQAVDSSFFSFLQETGVSLCFHASCSAKVIGPTVTQTKATLLYLDRAVASGVSQAFPLGMANFPDVLGIPIVPV